MHIEVMNASGLMINPFDLKVEDLDPRIVAQTLSRTCRFWGQTSEFYSVAQHCLIMESLFEDENLKKWSMIHEIFEGLTGMDLPSPIKHSGLLNEYVEAENRCLLMAAKHFNLTPPMPLEIKIADKRLMVTEALRFMNSHNYDWAQIAKPYKLSVIGRPMNIEEARIAFLTKWYELFN